MSFEIYLQDFADTPRDRRDAVGPLLRSFTDESGENIRTADGMAAVYGADDDPLTGLMLNHVEGELVWQVIFDLAVAGDWVIMPVGCPVCVVSEAQADSVPPELHDNGVVLVDSGSRLLDVIVNGSDETGPSLTNDDGSTASDHP
ncbi:hypothetical protein MUN74_04450 [Agromyces endophyticus]|uniref:hypothetical protein n=1 Tax=Agromyces sp. H17E-10 TaxID=2932244 RepID=UPI001FD54CD9|nr:hypothetical protein [Agromyces sp. H17E-10]UOQ90175.1 hypothetical protein MUN74_04450 [Agromyces sp. H17E-10]